MTMIRRPEPEAPIAKPETAGHWFPVRFTPDLVAGEQLNIGVGFIEKDNGMHVKMLDHFEKLSSLYENRLKAHDIAFLAKVVKSQLERERQTPGKAPSPQVSFGDPLPIYGTSASEILDWLYAEVVTLGTESERAPARPAQPRIDALRREVFDAIRHNNPLHAERIIAPDPLWVVSAGTDAGQQRALDMPLRGIGQFGTITSAISRRPQTRELRLLRATVDLETGLELNRKDKAGLFIMRPGENEKGFDEAIQREIDNDIDDLEWKFRLNKRLKLDVADDPGSLAKRIMNWADVA